MIAMGEEVNVSLIVLVESASATNLCSLGHVSRLGSCIMRLWRVHTVFIPIAGSHKILVR